MVRAFGMKAGLTLEEHVFSMTGQCSRSDRLLGIMHESTNFRSRQNVELCCQTWCLIYWLSANEELFRNMDADGDGVVDEEDAVHSLAQKAQKCIDAC